MALQQIAAISQDLEKIGPLLHHRDALVPIFATCNRAHGHAQVLIFIEVGDFDLVTVDECFDCSASGDATHLAAAVRSHFCAALRCCRNALLSRRNPANLIARDVINRHAKGLRTCQNQIVSSASGPFFTAQVCRARPSIARLPKARSRRRYLSAPMELAGAKPRSTAGLLIRLATASTRPETSSTSIRPAHPLVTCSVHADRSSGKMAAPSRSISR